MDSCYLCGSRVLRDFENDLSDFEYGAEGVYTFKYCFECGVAAIDPQPSDTILNDAYPADYHAYHEHSNPIARYLKRRYWKKKAAQCAAICKDRDASILDIGCGSGDFLWELKKIGFTNVQGLDFNKDAVAKARSKGLNVRHGVIEEGVFPDNSFDLIVMTNYIEHLFDPRSTLQLCKRFLKPLGILTGETPNIDSWDHRIFKRYWGGYHTPRHIFIFSTDSLCRLFEDLDFEKLKIINLMQPAHWALSIQNKLQDSHFKCRLFQGRASYFTVLLILFAPLNAFQAFFSRTSLIEFFFRKRSN